MKTATFEPNRIMKMYLFDFHKTYCWFDIQQQRRVSLLTASEVSVSGTSEVVDK